MGKLLCMVGTTQSCKKKQGKRSIGLLPERESAIYFHNRKLKRTCAIVLVVLLAVTGVGHHVATSIWGPYSIMKGTTFTDFMPTFDSVISPVCIPMPHEILCLISRSKTGFSNLSTTVVIYLAARTALSSDFPSALSTKSDSPEILVNLW